MTSPKELLDKVPTQLTSLNNITQSLRQKKSVVGGNGDSVDFRNTINQQIENGKNEIKNIKSTLSNNGIERQDKSRVNKFNNQFKQVSSDFEREATTVINLMLKNAIGTGGRSRELSINHRRSGSFNSRIQYKSSSSFSTSNYDSLQDTFNPQSNSSKNNSNSNNNESIQLEQLEITLSNAEPVEELILQEYNREVKNLVVDLQALKEISVEIQGLVVEQGEQLKQANAAIEDTNINVEGGAKTLGKASVLKNKYRKKVIILVVLLIILAGIIAIAIAVPLSKK